MSVNTGDKQVSAASTTSKTVKAMDLEQIRQAMAKRSLDVKFDLQDSGYKPVENIGIGAYGVVCSAVHMKSGDRVAIKKIPCVFDALTIAKRTYREIKILKHFKHDNIICIREILKPKESIKDFKDIYVVFDLMESDLHRIIYSKQDLSEEHVRYFLYQILRGLKYIHSANVIHRDLKPSNLLVNEDCHLRIGDFGMARGISYTPDEPSYYMTQYVATRWYRAPEILLSMLEYGTAVDMWSVGCIFAEMLGRKHLFPGKDYLTQVKLILGVLGTPSEKVMNNCQNDILKRIIKSFGKKNAVEWSKLFPKASKKSIDLLGKMLVLDPADRIVPERALSHRLLNNYHDPDDEPICVPAFNFDFEKEEMDKKRLRSAIMEEVMSFHEPKPATPALSFSAFLKPAPKDALETTGEEAEPVKDEPAVFADVQSGNRGASALAPQASVSVIPSSKPLPASLDTNLLGLGAAADVEMLSAQSTMDVQEGAPENIEEQAGSQEVDKGDGSQLPGDVKPSAACKAADKRAAATGNTISEDTKALVKQALMNATHRRQHAESQSEESKDSKPITAMQRQREREEKRRKKKERALEKIKKSKSRKGAQQDQTHLLTNQDMELLRRWTSMQKPMPANSSGQESGSNSNSNSSPPHPGPSRSPLQNLASSLSTSVGGTDTPQIVDNSSGIGFIGTSLPSNPRQIIAKAASSEALVSLNTPLRFSTTENSSGATVLIPSTQLGALGQANFIPVLAIPSVTTPGKVEIKRIIPQQQQQQRRPLKPSNVSSTSQDPTGLSTAANQGASQNTRNLLQNVLRERTTQGGAQPQYSAANAIVGQDNPGEASVAGLSIASGSTSGELPTCNLIGANSSSSFVPQAVPASTSHFLSAGQSNALSNTLQSNQTINIPLSREEGVLSPLGSASSELMEFLDQLKNSSVPKLGTDGEPSLHTPPLHSLNQSPLGLSPHMPHTSNIGEHGGVKFTGSLENAGPTLQGNVSVLRDHSSGVQESASVRSHHHHHNHQQQQELQRSISSSLPFLSYTESNGGSVEPQLPRPHRSSLPAGPYTNCHAACTPQEQNGVPFSFTNFGGGANISTQQHQQIVLGNRPSFPPVSFADDFLDGSTQQNPASTFLQNFASAEKIQQQHQQSMQMSLNPPVCQASDLLFQSSSDFSQQHNSHPHQRQSQEEKPHLHQHQQMQHIQQQQQNSMLGFFEDPASYSAVSIESLAASNKTLPPHQQVCNQNFSGFSDSSHPQPNFSTPDPSLHQSSPAIARQHSDSQFYRVPQQQQQQMQSNSGNSVPSTSGLAASGSRGLTVDCSKDVASTGVANIISTTTTSSSSTTTTDSSKASQSQAQRQADLIALLSKQLSRAEVADIFPPALALTPRGTGAGYGVGMDLDSLLTDAQDGASLRAENSPLSSSLLADWLDLSSNISQADLEALEREMALQSPMHVSYGDLGM